MFRLLSIFTCRLQYMCHWYPSHVGIIGRYPRLKEFQNTPLKPKLSTHSRAWSPPPPSPPFEVRVTRSLSAPAGALPPPSPSSKARRASSPPARGRSPASPASEVAPRPSSPAEEPPPLSAPPATPPTPSAPPATPPPSSLPVATLPARGTLAQAPHASTEHASTKPAVPSAGDTIAVQTDATETAAEGTSSAACAATSSTRTGKVYSEFPAAAARRGRARRRNTFKAHIPTPTAAPVSAIKPSSPSVETASSPVATLVRPSLTDTPPPSIPTGAGEPRPPEAVDGGDPSTATASTRRSGYNTRSVSFNSSPTTGLPVNKEHLVASPVSVGDSPRRTRVENAPRRRAERPQSRLTGRPRPRGRGV